MEKSISNVVWPAWIWLGSFAIAGSAPAWLGDAVWNPRTGGILILASICLAIANRFTRPAPVTVNNTAWVVFKAAGFGLLCWLFSLVSWLGLEIGFGGRVSFLIEALAGFLVGGLAGSGLYWLAHRRPKRWAECCRKITLGLAGVATVVFAALFMIFTGPHVFGRYPPSANSPYRLPWTGGVTRLCIQGNRAIVSHRDWEEFAYDFAMPVGSDIRASRGGTVVYVDVEHEGNGRHADNNLIKVDHGDGTFGWYLHLRQGGSYVKPGQKVKQGDVIGASGNVGMSLLPHLHFNVTDQEYRLLPVTFADVDSDGGIPRMFKRYTSGNSAADGGRR